MAPEQQLQNLGDVMRLPTQGTRSAVIDLRDAKVQEWTAFEFDAFCNAVGRGLERRGVGAAARVAIIADNRAEFVACYFGIMRIGALAVPVNHKLPRATIEHIFNDSAIEFAFTDAAHAEQVPHGISTVSFDESGGDGFAAFLDPGPLTLWSLPTTSAAGEWPLAEILYTSGSTGLPKGVPLDHDGQLWAIRHYLEPLADDAPFDTTVVVAPLYHMNGLFNITVALAKRVRVILLPRFEARRYLEAVATYRCTILSGIPTLFALMVRERELVERLDLTAVREILIGSAPLTDALLSQVQELYPNAQIRNGYGTTEAGPAVFGPHPKGLPRPPLALGFPYADVQCALVDGASADHGALALRTPALMKGYLNLPQFTAAKIKDGWYQTGDVMRRDLDGFYFFVGRADDMFVCGGENVYPGEIEKLLERHASVAQAIVVAAPDDIKGQIPVAFVVARSGFLPTVEEIKHYALQEGPAYAHPRFIEFMQSLPLSGTHKIDRVALTAKAEDIVRRSGRAARSVS